MRRLLQAMVGTVAGVMLGCGPRDEAGTGDSMAMSGAMSGDMMRQMMDSMDGHMRMMDTASAATMSAMMPMHHQMADSLITRMDADMRRMNMTGNSAWAATADSVRADLSRMRSMTQDSMRAVMPQHRARMMRLMEMHRAMMPPR